MPDNEFAAFVERTVGPAIVADLAAVRSRRRRSGGRPEEPDELAEVFATGRPRGADPWAVEPSTARAPLPVENPPAPAPAPAPASSERPVVDEPPQWAYDAAVLVARAYRQRQLEEAIARNAARPIGRGKS